ncbi:SpoIIE family protein phosphatase [Nonomuraea jiangxiensis]|uniref:protein-serine/threonine phosphatase n=1 Tax=Nonomuraea jiangxiensis TaxID=633440 RepID=A0A1G9AXF5_9ACTN|nr:SpoIIE family protein phosphatase [Nonomuraea jiangxiensis]SDK31295.1 PAS domain S-box-containing protein [Nonomuraea jiangxiensis]
MPDSTAEAGIPALAVIDAEGTVIGWTRAAQDLLGHRPGDVLDRPAAFLMMPGRRAWATTLGDAEHWSGLVAARHRDGGRVALHAEAHRLTTSGETTAWFLSAAPDPDVVGRSLLEPLIMSSPVSLCVWDLDLRCVWANQTAERTHGIRLADMAGRTPVEALRGFDTGSMEETMRRVLSDGVPTIDRQTRWVPPGESEERIFSASVFRLEGVAGRPVGLCSLALDISHSRARDRLSLLGQASRLGGTLDVRRTAQELADLAVPVVADYVTVDLSDAVLPDDEPLRRLQATEVSIPVFRRAGAASIHPDFRESLWLRGEAVFVPPTSPFTAVLNSRRSHFEPVLDTSDHTWLATDPDRLKIIKATGMHSLIIVPLQARGDILGITVFVRTENHAPFTRDDLDLAEELAARAALSLDNARQYTRERTAALALQRNLLPRNLTGGGAVEVASRYLPSDTREGVGGDWFDAIPLREGRIALVVGDVTGHGINAAATMGRLRTAVRTLAYLGLPPAELLTHLDEMAVRQAEEDTTAGGFPFVVLSATCLCVVYDPVLRRCTMAAAGHPPPAIAAPGGDVGFPELPTGTPIGLGLGSYESRDLELAGGTVIALYTDGLVETREADLGTGMDRLAVALSPASLPLEDLCDTVIGRMVGGAPPEDDVALLLARTLVPSP